MKIGIDANPWITERGGIGRYTESLIRSLLDIDQKNEYILFFNTVSQYHKRKIQVLSALEKYPNAKVKFRRFPGKIKDLLFDLGLPAPCFFGQKMDLFFAPYYSSIAKNGYACQIVTIHDLAFYFIDNLANEEQISDWKKWTERAISNSAAIVAISNSKRNDILKTFPRIQPDKIHVIHLGINHSVFYPINNFDPNPTKQRFSQGQDYLLSVCSLEPRKNLEKLIDAYSSLEPELQKRLKLLLVGEIRWKVETLLDKIKKNPNIIATGHISDTDLPNLYRAATLFVYPSIYEGFGLPPLEAMACGTPALIGSNSSLPEVGGNAAFYSDITDSQSIASKIKEIIALPLDKLKTASEQSVAHATTFSWNKSAAKLLELFHETYTKTNLH